MLLVSLLCSHVAMRAGFWLAVLLSCCLDVFLLWFIVGVVLGVIQSSKTWSKSVQLCQQYREKRSAMILNVSLRWSDIAEKEAGPNGIALLKRTTWWAGLHSCLASVNLVCLSQALYWWDLGHFHWTEHWRSCKPFFRTTTDVTA